MRIVLVFLLCLFFFLHGKAQSGRGCYVASTNTIYFPIIEVGELRVALLSNGRPTICPPGSTTATLVYLPASSGTSGCTIVASLIPLTLLTPGVVRDFRVVNCPIDDYAWLLVLSSASIVAFKIRRKSP
ncbi:MAG: hypothetical protein EOO42_06795 [Flavobacteriales bacterium]|nr:MAG: hypothetical protein EOO42_06795 [Flavobacteriales bacterium]